MLVFRTEDLNTCFTLLKVKAAHKSVCLCNEEIRTSSHQVLCVLSQDGHRNNFLGEREGGIKQICLTAHWIKLLIIWKTEEVIKTDER